MPTKIPNSIRLAGTIVSRRRNAGELLTSPAKIIAQCAEAFGVRMHDIFASRRGKELVAVARHAAMVIIRLKCHLTVNETGNIFHRDHGTVSFAFKKINARCDTDLAFKNTFQSLMAGIVLPYQWPVRAMKYIERTNELPKKVRHCRKPSIDIGLNVLRVVMVKERHQGGISCGAIASVCGVSKNAIYLIEQKALKHLREKLRRKLNLSFGQFALASASHL